MRLDTHNNRYCLICDNELDTLSFIKLAMNSVNINISENTRYHFGYGRKFFVIKGGYAEVGCYRENWNGWHDVARYDLNSGVSVAEINQPNYASGRHRASFVEANSAQQNVQNAD